MYTCEKRKEQNEAVTEFLDRIEKNDKPPLFGNKRKRHFRNSTGQITKLDLNKLQLKESDFALIGTFEHLVSVNLNDSNVRDADLKHLTGLERLRELMVTWTKSLVHVQQLKRLERLDLRATSIKDADIHLLGGLANLRRLNLSRTAITDSALKQLRGLSKLEMLDLRETKITDAGLRHLESLKKLRGLILGETSITEMGLKYLSNFPNFKWIASNDKTVREYIRRAEQSQFDAIERMPVVGVYLPDRGNYKLLKLDALPKNERDKRRELQRYYIEMHWTVPTENIDDVVHITFSVDRGTITGHQVGILQE